MSRMNGKKTHAHIYSKFSFTWVIKPCSRNMMPQRQSSRPAAR
ncbi:unnamed protein product [Ascophyllum nodosum]